MPKHPDPLAALAERIRKDSQLPVYPAVAALPEKEGVDFDGEDLGIFLNLASRSGAGMLYLVEVKATEDDEDPELAKRAGETEMVEAWFIANGIVHRFAKIAEWAKVENSESESAPAGRIEDAERAIRDDSAGIEKDFLELNTRETWINEPGPFEVGARLRSFVFRKFNVPEPRFHSLGNPDETSVLSQSIATLAQKISAKLLQEDQERADGMVVDAVSWAREAGVKTLSRSDVDAFLLERRASLWPSARRLLWTKAKFQVKTGK